MRNPRLIARHRGGLLEKDEHRRLAAWAADVAEGALQWFEDGRDDPRPREAIETARAWSRGEVPVGAAQKASVAAHAAAREANDPSAIAAARAAGHAVATAHMADHSFGAVIYSLKAVAASGVDLTAERSRQIELLPTDMAPWVLPALDAKLARVRFQGTKRKP